MKFIVGDGNYIENFGKFQKVELKIQNYNLESPFHMLRQGGVHAVLRIRWLQKLGTYFTNHQKNFLNFKWQGQRYKLFVFRPPHNKIVSSKHMMKLIWKGAPNYMIQCHTTTNEGCLGYYFAQFLVNYPNLRPKKNLSS